MTNRTPRELETREKEERPKQWKPPSLLPNPSRQDGYEYRYIRASTLGKADIKNFSQRKRDGWEPVKASEHPELSDVMSDVGSRFKDNIEIGGLVLCKNTTENVAARNEYYGETTQQQMESVDRSYLRENDPRMPLLKPERRSRTTFGSGG